MSLRYHKTGIPTSTGFDISAPRPIDSRLVADTKADILGLSEYNRYPGMRVYCISEKCDYRFDGKDWKSAESTIIPTYGKPDQSLGYIGSWAIDTKNGKLYYKADDGVTEGGIWRETMELVGPQGVSMRLRGPWSDNSVNYFNSSEWIDIVYYQGSTYACKLSHLSDTGKEPDKNPELFTLVALKGSGLSVEGKWQPNTDYYCDFNKISVIEHNGSIYVCKESHNSGDDFTPSLWTVLSSKGDKGQSFAFRNAWQPGTAYRGNTQYRDIVRVGSELYIAKEDHFSVVGDLAEEAAMGEKLDATKWAVYTIVHQSSVIQLTDDVINTGIKYDANMDNIIIDKETGAMYTVTGNVPPYTSKEDFIKDPNVHAVANASTKLKIVEWEPNTKYSNGDPDELGNAVQHIVLYNDTSYVCKTSHTSGADFDPDMFIEFLQKGVVGISHRFKGVWQEGAEYVNDERYIDSFTYEGNLYIALETHTAVAGGPTATQAVIVAHKGEKGTSLRYRGEWAKNTDYVNDEVFIDVVTQAGSTYICIESHNSGTGIPATVAAGDILEETGYDTPIEGPFVDSDHWEMVAAKGDKGTSIRFRGEWRADTPYANNDKNLDVVTYQDTTYICIAPNGIGVVVGTDGNIIPNTWNDADWQAISKVGGKGDDGKSAYAIAVENGFVGTEAEWLASLKGATGAKGNKGDDGKSAYDIAVEDGYTGIEADWLASLKGPKGDKGDDGDDGSDGIPYTPVVGTVTSGTTANVDITLDNTNKTATFDFVLPKGDKGDTPIVDIRNVTEIANIQPNGKVYDYTWPTNNGGTFKVEQTGWLVADFLNGYACLQNMTTDIRDSGNSTRTESSVSSRIAIPVSDGDTIRVWFDAKTRNYIKLYEVDPIKNEYVLDKSNKLLDVKLVAGSYTLSDDIDNYDEITVIVASATDTNVHYIPSIINIDTSVVGKTYTAAPTIITSAGVCTRILVQIIGKTVTANPPANYDGNDLMIFARKFTDIKDIRNNLVIDTQDILCDYILTNNSTGTIKNVLSKNAEDYDRVECEIYTVDSQNGDVYRDIQFWYKNAVVMMSEYRSNWLYNVQCLISGRDLTFNECICTTNVEWHFKITGYKYIAAEDLMNNLVIDSKELLCDYTLTNNSTGTIKDILSENVEEFNKVECKLYSIYKSTGKKMQRAHGIYNPGENIVFREFVTGMSLTSNWYYGIEFSLNNKNIIFDWLEVNDTDTYEWHLEVTGYKYTTTKDLMDNLVIDSKELLCNYKLTNGFTGTIVDTLTRNAEEFDRVECEIHSINKGVDSYRGYQPWTEGSYVMLGEFRNGGWNHLVECSLSGKDISIISCTVPTASDWYLKITGYNYVKAEDIKNDLVVDSKTAILKRTAITKNGTIKLSDSVNNYDEVICNCYASSIAANALYLANSYHVQDGTCVDWVYADGSTRAYSITFNGEEATITNFKNTIASNSSLYVEAIGIKYANVKDVKANMVIDTEEQLCRYELADGVIGTFDDVLSDDISNYDRIECRLCSKNKSTGAELQRGYNIYKPGNLIIFREHTSDWFFNISFILNGKSIILDYSKVNTTIYTWYIEITGIKYAEQQVVLGIDAEDELFNGIVAANNKYTLNHSLDDYDEIWFATYSTDDTTSASHHLMDQKTLPSNLVKGKLNLNYLGLTANATPAYCRGLGIIFSDRESFTCADYINGASIPMGPLIITGRRFAKSDGSVKDIDSAIKDAPDVELQPGDTVLISRDDTLAKVDVSDLLDVDPLIIDSQVTLLPKTAVTANGKIKLFDDITKYDAVICRCYSLYNDISYLSHTNVITENLTTIYCTMPSDNRYYEALVDKNEITITKFKNTITDICTLYLEVVGYNYVKVDDVQPEYVIDSKMELLPFQNVTSTGNFTLADNVEEYDEIVANFYLNSYLKVTNRIKIGSTNKFTLLYNASKLAYVDIVLDGNIATIETYQNGFDANININIELTGYKYTESKDLISNLVIDSERVLLPRQVVTGNGTINLTDNAEDYDSMIVYTYLIGTDGVPYIWQTDNVTNISNGVSISFHNLGATEYMRTLLTFDKNTVTLASFVSTFSINKVALEIVGYKYTKADEIIPNLVINNQKELYPRQQMTGNGTLTLTDNVENYDDIIGKLYTYSTNGKVYLKEVLHIRDKSPATFMYRGSASSNVGYFDLDINQNKATISSFNNNLGTMYFEILGIKYTRVNDLLSQIVIKDRVELFDKHITANTTFSNALPTSADEYDFIIAELYTEKTTDGLLTTRDTKLIGNNQTTSMWVYNDPAYKASFDLTINDRNVTIGFFTNLISATNIHLRLVGIRFMDADSLQHNLVIDSQRELIARQAITAKTTITLTDNSDYYDDIIGYFYVEGSTGISLKQVMHIEHRSESDPMTFEYRSGDNKRAWFAATLVGDKFNITACENEVGTANKMYFELIGTKYVNSENLISNLVIDKQKELLPRQCITKAGDTITLTDSVENYDDILIYYYLGSSIRSTYHFKNGASNEVIPLYNNNNLYYVHLTFNKNTVYITNYQNATPNATEMYVEIIGYKYTTAESLIDNLVIESKNTIFDRTITANTKFGEVLDRPIEEYDLVTGEFYIKSGDGSDQYTVSTHVIQRRDVVMIHNPSNSWYAKFRLITYGKNVEITDYGSTISPSIAGLKLIGYKFTKVDDIRDNLVRSHEMVLCEVVPSKIGEDFTFPDSIYNYDELYFQQWTSGSLFTADIVPTASIVPERDLFICSMGVTIAQNISGSTRLAVAFTEPNVMQIKEFNLFNNAPRTLKVIGVKYTNAEDVLSNLAIKSKDIIFDKIITANAKYTNVLKDYAENYDFIMAELYTQNADGTDVLVRESGAIQNRNILLSYYANTNWKSSCRVYVTNKDVEIASYSHVMENISMGIRLIGYKFATVENIKDNLVLDHKRVLFDGNVTAGANYELADIVESYDEIAFYRYDASRIFVSKVVPIDMLSGNTIIPLYYNGMTSASAAAFGRALEVSLSDAQMHIETFNNYSNSDLKLRVVGIKYMKAEALKASLAVDREDVLFFDTVSKITTLTDALAYPVEDYDQVSCYFGLVNKANPIEQYNIREYFVIDNLNTVYLDYNCSGGWYAIVEFSMANKDLNISRFLTTLDLKIYNIVIKIVGTKYAERAISQVLDNKTVLFDNIISGNQTFENALPKNIGEYDLVFAEMYTQRTDGSQHYTRYTTIVEKAETAMVHEATNTWYVKFRMIIHDRSIGIAEFSSTISPSVAGLRLIGYKFVKVEDVKNDFVIDTKFTLFTGTFKTGDICNMSDSIYDYDELQFIMHDDETIYTEKTLSVDSIKKSSRVLVFYNGVSGTSAVVGGRRLIVVMSENTFYVEGKDDYNNGDFDLTIIGIKYTDANDITSKLMIEPEAILFDGLLTEGTTYDLKGNIYDYDELRYYRYTDTDGMFLAESVGTANIIAGNRVWLNFVGVASATTTGSNRMMYIEQHESSFKAGGTKDYGATALKLKIAGVKYVKPDDIRANMVVDTQRTLFDGMITNGSTYNLADSASNYDVIDIYRYSGTHIFTVKSVPVDMLKYSIMLHYNGLANATTINGGRYLQINVTGNSLYIKSMNNFSETDLSLKIVGTKYAKLPDLISNNLVTDATNVIFDQQYTATGSFDFSANAYEYDELVFQLCMIDDTGKICQCTESTINTHHYDGANPIILGPVNSTTADWCKLTFSGKQVNILGFNATSTSKAGYLRVLATRFIKLKDVQDDYALERVDEIFNANIPSTGNYAFTGDPSIYDVLVFQMYEYDTATGNNALVGELSSYTAVNDGTLPICIRCQWSATAADYIALRYDDTNVIVNNVASTTGTNIILRVIGKKFIKMDDITDTLALDAMDVVFDAEIPSTGKYNFTNSIDTYDELIFQLYNVTSGVNGLCAELVRHPKFDTNDTIYLREQWSTKVDGLKFTYTNKQMNILTRSIADSTVYLKVIGKRYVKLEDLVTNDVAIDSIDELFNKMILEEGHNSYKFSKSIQDYDVLIWQLFCTVNRTGFVYTFLCDELQLYPSFDTDSDATVFLSDSMTGANLEIGWDNNSLYIDTVKGSAYYVGLKVVGKKYTRQAKSQAESEIVLKKYSTEEQHVGSWIDGSAVYEIVVPLDLSKTISDAPSLSPELVPIAAFSDIKEVVSFDAVVHKDTQNDTQLSQNGAFTAYCINNRSLISFSYTIEDDKLYIYYYRNESDGYTSYTNGHMIIRYTKRS